MLFGDRQIATPRLTVPHYDMKNRAFMLLPLVHIAPDVCFPDGVKVANILANLDPSGISRW